MPKYKFAASPAAIGLCLAHAGIVSLIWVWAFSYGHDEIMALVGGAKGWMSLGAAWLAWPLILLVAPVEWRFRWYAALVVGVLILAVAIPTLYTYLVWTIGGFV